MQVFAHRFDSLDQHLSLSVLSVEDQQDRDALCRDIVTAFWSEERYETLDQDMLYENRSREQVIQTMCDEATWATVDGCLVMSTCVELIVDENPDFFTFMIPR